MLYSLSDVSGEPSYYSIALKCIAVFFPLEQNTTIVLLVLHINKRSAERDLYKYSVTAKGKAWNIEQ